jgi:hypothetical protein
MVAPLYMAACLCLVLALAVEDPFGTQEGGKIHLIETDVEPESRRSRECGRQFLNSKLSLSLSLDTSLMTAPLQLNEKVTLTLNGHTPGTSSPKNWCGASQLPNGSLTYPVFLCSAAGDLFVWARIVGPAIMMADVTAIAEKQCSWWAIVTSNPCIPFC